MTVLICSAVREDKAMMPNLMAHNRSAILLWPSSESCWLLMGELDAGRFKRRILSQIV